MCRQAGAAGQAAAEAAGAQLASVNLQPDDTPAGHTGGLLPVPRLQVLPHRRYMPNSFNNVLDSGLDVLLAAYECDAMGSSIQVNFGVYLCAQACGLLDV